MCCSDYCQNITGLLPDTGITERSALMTSCSIFSFFKAYDFIGRNTLYLDFLTPSIIIHPPAVLENALTIFHIDFDRSPVASFTSKSFHSISLGLRSSSFFVMSLIGFGTKLQNNSQKLPEIQILCSTMQLMNWVLSIHFRNKKRYAFLYVENVGISRYCTRIAEWFSRIWPVVLLLHLHQRFPITYKLRCGIVGSRFCIKHRWT